jgi:hypothetical protein
MDECSHILDFGRLDANQHELRQVFAAAGPFRHVVIDNFADDKALYGLVNEIPAPHEAGIGRSRDYVFAKNKFEKSEFSEFGPYCQALYADLCSNRFSAALRNITGEDVFVDPAFHGGGLHQGGERSFLDLHVDFNAHPLHTTWFRNLNVLLYLNPDWEPSWRGSLQLRHRLSGDEASIEPLFNRCVIMETRDFTLHGFGPIAFPPGVYRRSIACYAYTQMNDEFTYRSTTWYPQGGGVAKRLAGRAWPSLVRVKNRVLGSATAKN